MTTDKAPLVWVMMGVAGSGKTLIGRLWAAQLDCDFLEGDRRHPVANIQKMAAQTPLTEGDRRQWLDAIATEIHGAIHDHREMVITCSALRHQHRQFLAALGRVQLVWIDVPEGDLRRRLEQRGNHYMHTQMLDSQLATFEAVQATESILIVEGTGRPQDIIQKIWGQAVNQYPLLTQPWWQR